MVAVPVLVGLAAGRWTPVGLVWLLVLAARRPGLYEQRFPRGRRVLSLLSRK
ncbi:hypothetical protein ACIREE_06750 [Streptomyces sp. NPDC102467]|uniref:hypothetical protein n=1 Tax=Streptomyces sp. NPDC102467 TaxID=3366179 RepID=UPI0037F6206D